MGEGGQGRQRSPPPTCLLHRNSVSETARKQPSERGLHYTKRDKPPHCHTTPPGHQKGESGAGRGPRSEDVTFVTCQGEGIGWLVGF